MTGTTLSGQIRAARLAGAMFLFINAAGIFSQVFVRDALGDRDATQAAQNIQESERLFRLGIATDLLIFAGVLVLVWALYKLLRPVGRDLAILAACFRGLEVPVGVSATVHSLISLRLLGAADSLQTFTPEQLHALSRLSRASFGYGQDVGFVFLGLGSALFAYLLWKSRYVPRVFAGWGVFASLLFALYNLLVLVYPEWSGTLMVVAFAPMGIYELGLGLWLVLRSARVQRQPSALT